jgi:putative transposase
VHDQLATGRKIRVLTVVGTFSRYSPAIDPGFSYGGEDVAQILDRICAEVGYLATIRVDQARRRRRSGQRVRLTRSGSPGA